ncbi:MAG: hemolysin family protein [Saprospiraceae bacterium]|nr:hemolysin family protein [Saprospiraceae bacterium]HMW37830.1 hemolysin family protein [Saprospiraceae bacterium]HMX87516.1 hemolysin family protein [Saprospiraceae bacterium]HMZ39606.1 hemolysin family protein [Saprospiraceae bacterium]HNA63721.1 hemolysin family protein [Saprospiraceae bacterium]
MLFFWIFLFLLLSAFFAGTEIAFFTANKLGVEIKKSKGTPSSKILSYFYDHPDKFITVMLIGNSISLVSLSYLLTALFNSLLQPLDLNHGVLIALNTALTTLVILVIGEFLPKVLFTLYANELIFPMAYVVQFFYKLLYVPAIFIHSISRLMIKLFFKESETKPRYRFSALDLEHYIDGPMRISEDEIDADIFKNTLNLKQVRAKACMIPRNEIVYVDVNCSREELIKTFSDTKHSRIIVADEDIDNVLGYIHHQQMFKKTKNVRDMIMDIPFVPETMNVYDLMLRMNKLRLSVACVVDEFGGTSGIITQEDILEEIFGEIDDEHDKEEFIEQVISEHEYLFSGRLEIQYLNNTYNLHLKSGDYHTLSGYLVSTTGTIPEQGLELIQDGYKFVLELVSDTKIETVRIFKIDDPD